MIKAKGTPNLLAVIELRFWFAGCGDVELVGAMTGFCNVATIQLDEGLIKFGRKVAELNEYEGGKVSNDKG